MQKTPWRVLPSAFVHIMVIGSEQRSPHPLRFAAGMGAGLPKYVTINLGQLSKFSEGEEVTLQSLEQKRIFSLSGREDRLPLKVRACRPVT